jgi:hypothetical protein
MRNGALGAPLSKNVVIGNNERIPVRNDEWSGHEWTGTAKVTGCVAPSNLLRVSLRKLNPHALMTIDAPGHGSNRTLSPHTQFVGGAVHQELRLRSNQMQLVINHCVAMSFKSSQWYQIRPREKESYFSSTWSSYYLELSRSARVSNRIILYWHFLIENPIPIFLVVFHSY